MNRQSILILAAVFLFVVTPWSGKPAFAGAYGGGTGEPNDPFRIATAEDLNDIGNYPEGLDEDCTVDGADLDDSNDVDFLDFGIFSGNWRDCTDPNLPCGSLCSIVKLLSTRRLSKRN